MELKSAIAKMGQIKLILDEKRGDYEAGEQLLEVPGVSRQVRTAW